MLNCFYDCYTILNKVYSDGAYFKQALNQTLIEEKNRALTVKICYGVLDKDIELSYCIKKLADKSPKLAIRTIIKISMYAIKYLEKKPYAVIDNAVELTKKLGKKGASGFVNAILRKFISLKMQLPKNIEQNLSIKYSTPEFLVQDLLKTYGQERTESILNTSNVKTTLCFYDINGEEYLKNLGIEYQKTVFDNVYYAKNFIRNADYDKGIYTYQAIGSVAICDVVEPCENLLDCCSAPGGKSVRLSYKCDNVTSFDIHEHRVELVKDYARRMKRDNITASVKDAKIFDKTLENSFDAVLVDAPCSGTGVFNDNPDMKLNKNAETVKGLNVEQLCILENVSKYVKVGGYLYYSTCSITSSENYSIIEKFLQKNNGFSICELNSKLNHQNINGTNLFLPDISDGLGFYVAKLKRVK